jgi:DNA-binding CsgD family transcriptional regulator
MKPRSRRRDGPRDTQHEAELIERMLATAPVGFGVLTHDLRFLFLNDALKSLARDPVRDAEGRPLRAVIPLIAAHVEALCQEVLTKGQPIENHEIQISAEAGKVGRWYLTSIYSVRRKGQAIQVGLIIRDVTSYKLFTIGNSTAVSVQDFLGVLAAAADGSKDRHLLPESQLFALQRFLAAFHEAAKLIHSLLWETERKKSGLTSRETQVLKHLAEGKTSKEIARILGVSLKTIAAHRSNLMDKLDMHDVASLVRYAVRHGLILP